MGRVGAGGARGDAGVWTRAPRSKATRDLARSRVNSQPSVHVHVDCRHNIMQSTAMLLDWLRTEGAEGLENVSLRHTKQAGWGLFLECDELPSGHVVFRCPASVALTADQALSYETIGAAL